MFKLIKVISFLALAFVLVLVINTMTKPSIQPTPSTFSLADVDEDAAAQRLAKAVTFQTISKDQIADMDLGEFTRFAAFLSDQFPLVHQRLNLTKISEYSLLYHWQGSDAELAPMMLLAHMDVVPVDEGSHDRWEYPAFSATIADGYIWGRGTLDDKGSLMSILESTEILLAEGFTPKQDIYFGFGHDEEIGGELGAMKIVEWLTKHNIELGMVIDEGMIITDGGIPGIDKPVALIGIAEKGYLSVELTASSEGGHASMPPKDSAISLLSGAVNRLNTNQMTASLSGPIEAMFTTLAPEMSLPYNVVFSNMTLLNPVVKSVFAGQPATNAMLRTTTAPTMFHAGVKDNVLPTQASAIVNFRIHPNDSIAAVLSHINQTIDDPRVNAAEYQGTGQEPSKVSAVNSPEFDAIQVAVKTVFGDIYTTAGLMIGASDARHYDGIAKQVFRFNPAVLKPTEYGKIHGSNERISVENYRQSIQFYHQLIQLATSEQP